MNGEDAETTNDLSLANDEATLTPRDINEDNLDLAQSSNRTMEQQGDTEAGDAVIMKNYLFIYLQFLFCSI